MEELSTEKLNETIPSVEEDTLLATLPDLSVDKLLSLDAPTLFASLPSAPVAQISGEVPPEPPEGYRDAPVVVYVTLTGEKAVAIKTPDKGWVTVIGTPAPIQQIMIKTNKELQDVSTTLEIHDQLPSEALVMLPDGQVVRSYITISFENASPEDIDLGHIAFYVEKDWLEQNSIHKWSVALHRYDPELNKWIALPTKRVAEDDDYIDYTAVITHFSTFAISGSEALPAVDFETSNLVISPAEAESGEDITISVDVTNNAGSAGTYVATLWVDSTVEAGKDVYVEAGKTESVSFTVTQLIEGSYEVRIDRLIGSFSVGEAAPPEEPEAPPVAPEAPTVTPEEPVVPEAPPVTPPEEPVTPPAVTPTNWWLIGGIIAAVIIIAVVVWLWFTRRRY